MIAWNYCTVWTVTSTSLLSRCLVFPASLYAAEKQGSICTCVTEDFSLVSTSSCVGALLSCAGRMSITGNYDMGPLWGWKLTCRFHHISKHVWSDAAVLGVWGDTYWEYSTISTQRHSACFPPNDVMLVQPIRRGPRRPRSVCLLPSVPGPAGWSSRSLWPTSGFDQPTSDLGATLWKAAQFLIVHFYIIQGWNLSFS